MSNSIYIINVLINVYISTCRGIYKNDNPTTARSTNKVLIVLILRKFCGKHANCFYILFFAEAKEGKL